MENHESKTWFGVQSVPKSHTFSLEDRPGTEPIPTCRAIPIIDLGGGNPNPSRIETLQEIMKASQEFGFFQVINHGVQEDIINEAMKVLEEIFNMPSKEILKDAKENGYVYMGSCSHSERGAHLWRDNIKHPCHPLYESMHHWPQKPARYREVVSEYIIEMRKLSLRILEKISEGLGLEKGYLGGISIVQFMTASNYPVCPDPSLTLGLLEHFDHSLITILFQGEVEGLQVLKDGKWIGVGIVPNAFVVNLGTQVEIISNGKLRSAEHRVVTNREKARTTIAAFINPFPDCIIEPSKVLVNDLNPPLYQSLSFNQFVISSKAFGPHTEAVQNAVL